jgi:hypothetical protein
MGKPLGPTMHGLGLSLHVQNDSHSSWDENKLILQLAAPRAVGLSQSNSSLFKEAAWQRFFDLSTSGVGTNEPYLFEAWEQQQ